MLRRSFVDLDDAEDGRFADDALRVVGGAQQGRHHFRENGDGVGLRTLLNQPRQRFNGRVVLRVVVADGVLQNPHQFVQRQDDGQRLGAALSRTHHLVNATASFSIVYVFIHYFNFYFHYFIIFVYSSVYFLYLSFSYLFLFSLFHYFN